MMCMYCIMLLIDSLRNVVCVCLLYDIMVLYFPQRILARRMPLAVRREVAKQLRDMQKAGVIQPSVSPWSSPVVMVKKKDGTQRFCVDYRALNSVTRGDTFPLPRIDDLLDQLGNSRFFSTLDLASGYWQIRLSQTSREKTGSLFHKDYLSSK